MHAGPWYRTWPDTPGLDILKQEFGLPLGVYALCGLCLSRTHQQYYRQDSAANKMRRADTKPCRAPRAFAAWLQGQEDCDLDYITGLIKRGCTADTVIVIENIDQHWIKTIADVWNVDLSFFAEHGDNPSTTLSPWPAVFGDETSEPSPCKDYWHVDGVFQYGSSNETKLQDVNIFNRILAFDPTYGWQMTTRISYMTKVWSGNRTSTWALVVEICVEKLTIMYSASTRRCPSRMLRT